MRKMLITGFAIMALLHCSFNLYAQGVKDFEIDIPKSSKARKINARYSTLTILDSRYDTTHVGFSMNGMGRNLIVIPKPPLNEQIQHVFNEIKNPNASASGELLLHIRRFEFSAVPTGGGGAISVCHLHFILYAKEEEGYSELLTMDTAIEGNVFSGNGKAHKDASNAIVTFFYEATAEQAPKKRKLTWEYVSKIDSFEKLNIPIYRATTYKDGLYYSFRSFKNHTPDRTEFFVNRRESDSQITAVKQLNEKGKQRRPDALYAFIENGNIFIFVHSEFYPVVKKKDDFVFSGKIEDFRPSPSVFGMGILDRLLAEALFSGMSKKYNVLIDHRTGSFVKTSRVK